MDVEVQNDGIIASSDCKMQADTFALGSTQRQLKRRSTIKKKTTLLDINAYRQRQNLNSLEEALLSIIQENDRVSYPEERIQLYN